MRRLVFVIVLISSALAAQAVPGQRAADPAPAPHGGSAAPQRKIPCKTPENASMCYWTHGRLNCCNGNPPMKMWKVGTMRLLAIYSGPKSLQSERTSGEPTELPSNLDAAFRAEIERNKDRSYFIGSVFADYEVCPLEPEHEGRMQAVCIESAKNIFVEDSKRSYR